MTIDDDGCHRGRDTSEALEVDNSSGPRVKTKDLTDPGAVIYDWTATTASIKQPDLHLQDTDAVENDYEDDGERRSRVAPYHRAATASSMTQSESNLPSNPSSNPSRPRAIARLPDLEGSATPNCSGSRKNKRPRLNPDDASHTQFPQALQVIPSFPMGQFRGCGMNDERSQTPNPHSPMNLPPYDPNGGLWGMNSALSLSQESQQTNPRVDIVPISVEPNSEMIRTFCFSQSSGGRAESMMDFSKRCFEAEQQGALEAYWGLSNASCPTNNADPPTQPFEFRELQLPTPQSFNSQNSFSDFSKERT